jgi:hypothetical protein
VIKAVKVIVLLVALFMLFSVFSFVKAENRVSATSTTIEILPSGVGDYRVTPSGEIQLRGYTNQIFGVIAVNGAPIYDVYSSNTLDANWIPRTKTYLVHYDATWYVDAYSAAWEINPTWYTSQPTSGFAGNIEVKYLNAELSITETGIVTLASFSLKEAHCVLQGFGGLAGQTLKLDFKGTALTGGAWTGVVVVPP